MEDVLRADGTAFPVICVWCGGEIRRTSRPEPPAMCQACFRQMVEEHTRLAARQQASLYASER